MAGLLEALFNGGLSTNDIQDEQGAMLADLLRRLEAGQAQGTSVGMTPVIANHIARGTEIAVGGGAPPDAQPSAQAPPAVPAAQSMPFTTRGGNRIQVALSGPPAGVDAAPAAPPINGQPPTMDPMLRLGMLGDMVSLFEPSLQRQPLPLRDTTGSPTVAALPYQPPDAAIVPEDIARRDATRPRPPAPSRDDTGGSVDALMQASMMPDQAAGRGAPSRAPIPPASRPAAPAAQTGNESSLGERLSAFGRGYNQGGLVGAVGDMMQGGDSATVRAVMRRLNVDRDTARAIAGNPQLAPILFGNRTAPTIVKIPGPYGQEIDMVWNAQSGRLEPLSSLMAPGVQTQPQPQPMIPGGAPAPGPGAVPPQPQGQAPAPPALNLSGQPAAAPPAASGAVPGALAPVAPAQPAPASGAPGATGGPPAAQPQQGVGDYVVGQAVPKPPEGYVHRLAPNGQGYLWTRDGRPVFESRAEAEARARLGERRADTTREQQTQIAGVERVIADARRLAEAPGFQQALDVGNLSFPIGVPTPWGYVGGDIFNPVRSAVRAGDRVINGSNQNAAWSVGDEVAAVQQRLNLLVARPLMRGQGAVTDSERQMIGDAIGSLGRATDATDYQFRLNSIQRMIEDMNSGQMRPADNYNARPTREEILSAIDGGRGVYITSRIAELAAKYNVRPYDMTNYVLRMHRTLVGS